MGGYILLRSSAGLCDSLFMLEMLTPFAVQHNRTIVWDLLLYSASDIDSLFNFSNYPVPVLCGIKHMKDVIYDKIFPECFESDPYTIPSHVGCNLFHINGTSAQFDMSKEYVDSNLLIYFGAVGGHITLTNLYFSKSVIDEYYAKMSTLPEKFDAVHLRATDHYDQNIEKNLEEIDVFVKSESPVYLSTDNMKLMESLSEKYNNIIKSFSYEKIETSYRSLHHNFGNCDPNALKNAILDILICASSDKFLKSVGGFSRLINNIHSDKELLRRLLGFYQNQEPTTEDEGEGTIQPDELDATEDEGEGTIQPDELDATEDEGEEEQSHQSEGTIQPDESASLC